VGERGHVFVFEGPDGVGKSRRARQTAAFLQQMGVPCAAFAFPGKEPGTLGLLVQTLQVRPEEFGIRPLSSVTTQALQIAVQVEVVERQIMPRLLKGQCVVVDRFWWSSWVYGTEMGADSTVLDGLIDVGQRAWRDAKPSAIFLLERARPLRAEQSPESFRVLSSLYRKLASRETRTCPVHVIADENFASAQRRIQHAVEQTLKQTTRRDRQCMK